MAGLALSTGTPLDVRITRAQVDEILADNQLGEFVGLRALIAPIGEGGWHSGFFLAGTLGYAEINKAGGVILRGAWMPEAVLR